VPRPEAVAETQDRDQPGCDQIEHFTPTETQGEKHPRADLECPVMRSRRRSNGQILSSSLLAAEQSGGFTARMTRIAARLTIMVQCELRVGVRETFGEAYDELATMTPPVLPRPPMMQTEGLISTS